MKSNPQKRRRPAPDGMPMRNPKVGPAVPEGYINIEEWGIETGRKRVAAYAAVKRGEVETEDYGVMCIRADWRERTPPAPPGRPRSAAGNTVTRATSGGGRPRTRTRPSPMRPDPSEKGGRDPAAGASALMMMLTMFHNPQPPWRAAAQTDLEDQIDRSLKSKAAVARKTAPKPTTPQRASAVLVRLLGADDLPILVTDPERAERCLRHGLVPPVLCVERGQETKVLGSAVAMAAPAAGWPLSIVAFEAGHGVVTRFAGIDLVDEVLL
jgi:hypothetical protein